MPQPPTYETLSHFPTPLISSILDVYWTIFTAAATARHHRPPTHIIYQNLNRSSMQKRFSLDLSTRNQPEVVNNIFFHEDRNRGKQRGVSAIPRTATPGLTAEEEKIVKRARIKYCVDDYAAALLLPHIQQVLGQLGGAAEWILVRPKPKAVMLFDGESAAQFKNFEVSALLITEPPRRGRGGAGPQQQREQFVVDFALEQFGRDPSKSKWYLPSHKYFSEYCDERTVVRDPRRVGETRSRVEGRLRKDVEWENGWKWRMEEVRRYVETLDWEALAAMSTGARRVFVVRGVLMYIGLSPGVVEEVLGVMRTLFW